MTIDEVVARCSKYSGFKLEWRIRKCVLEIEEPGKPQSCLALKLYHPESDVLYEVYGRMRHWGISLEEKTVLAAALREPPAPVTQEVPSLPAQRSREELFELLDADDWTTNW